MSLDRLLILIEIVLMSTILFASSSKSQMENFLIKPASLEQAILGIVALNLMLVDDISCKISNVEWDPNLIDTSALPIIHYHMNLLTEVPTLELDEPFVDMSPYGIYKFLVTNNIQTSLEKVAQDMVNVVRQIKFREDLFKQLIPPEIKLENCYGIHVAGTDNYNRMEIKDRMRKNLEEFTSTVSTFTCLIVSDDPKYTRTLTTQLKIIKKRNSFLDIQMYSIDTNVVPPALVRDYPQFKEHFVMYCLSKCKGLLQVMEHSDFSLLAAFMSQIPLFAFDNSDTLSLWKPCLRLVTNGVEKDHVIDTVELEGTFTRIFSS